MGVAAPGGEVLPGSSPAVPDFPVLPPLTGVGVVAPYDFALDRELWRWCPEDVTLLATRLPVATPFVTIDSMAHVGEIAPVAAATQDVLTVHPQVMAFCCTSGSFVRGREGEHALVAAMLGAGAPAAVTTSGALLEALAHLHVSAVGVATPYVQEVTWALHDFLGTASHVVVSGSELGLDHEIWTLPYHVVAELIRRADHPQAEAIVVSCTNVPTYDLIAPLEAELGKPIITANQVTMWAALREIGLAAVGRGQRLLES
ncbi:MAG TPA: hypothetical protein VFL99_16835 [Segeticoccus sp.]|uniref:maleate cis-trans isomerase family protein n=1 Tax=Segeticoccus sp. TaxID=2706531 RepID=UPI002D805523|nr:hypothetical protein [Segeticoccus sp.]HET8601993.1 hypothetical protein [Segeticoccus sp.]